MPSVSEWIQGFWPCLISHKILFLFDGGGCGCGWGAGRDRGPGPVFVFDVGTRQLRFRNPGGAPEPEVSDWAGIHHG